MSDTPTLARFVTGYVQTGTGKDGLPIYEETVQIMLERPPYLQVMRDKTDEDEDNYPDPWKMFQREQRGRKLDGHKGYPLAMWPALSPAELHMCLARDIHTVEQLAKLAVGKAEVPPQVVEIAKRAKRMIELSSATGKHEATITTLEGQIGALREQNNEQQAEIATLRTQIGILQAQKAA